MGEQGGRCSNLLVTGRLLLPQLIYSEDHLGTGNNVLSYLKDGPH